MGRDTKVKKSLSGIGTKSPDVERLVSLGHLGQLLTASVTRGGTDSRFVTRSELLEEGAPLQVERADGAVKN